MLWYEKRVGDIWVKRSQSFDFIPHIHHNIEILICTSGQMNVVCNGTSQVLHRGNMMIAYSHNIHSYFYKAPGEGVMIIVSPQLIPLITVKLQERHYGNFYLDENDHLANLAESLLAEFESDRKQTVMVGYLYVLLGTAMKSIPYKRDHSQANTDTFSAALEYLSSHYTEEISLKSLSKHFGIDPSYLSRMFSQRLSIGFLKYLHMLRVEHAKNLLINTDLKISQIYLKSGFSDQKTFNRVFYEVVEMTPTEFREHHSS